MDNQRFDRMTKQVATGLSRRQAMTGIAVALGLSAFGGLRAPTAAGGCWRICEYSCPTLGSQRFCQSECRNQKRIQGESCGLAQYGNCWGSKSSCDSNNR